MAADARIIAHIDLDCFYAQVEANRLGVPADQPFCVQQWGGLLAVNYAARKYNIKRLGDDPVSAAIKCPGIQFCHVKLDPWDTATPEHLAYLARLREATTDTARPTRGDGQVSLKLYREAGRAVMDCIKDHTRLGNAVISKTSIDEFFVDLTSLVADESAAPSPEATRTHVWCGDFDKTSVSSLSSLSSSSSSSSSRHPPIRVGLLRAAELVAEARRVVSEKLHYNMSAGISSNKMLAKIASSKHKPNKQTIVPDWAIQNVLRELKLTDIPGLGGETGKDVMQTLSEELNSQQQQWGAAVGDGGGGVVVESAEAVQVFEKDYLIRLFGAETGKLVWDRCRGIDETPIVESYLPKSINTFKNVSASCETEAQLREWLHKLSKQLAERVVSDHAANHRWPQKLSFARGVSNGFGSRRGISMLSRSMAFPRNSPLTPSTLSVSERLEAQILAQALKLVDGLKSEGKAVVPCFRIGIALTDMIYIAQGTGSIASHFRCSASADSNIQRKEEAEEDWEDDEREKQHQHQHQHRHRHLGNYEGEAEYSADVSDVLRCDREGCGLTFLDFDRWQEHLDEHVAKELQADERRKEQQQIKKPPSPRGGQKITEFFSTQKSKKRRRGEFSNF
jgi:DNA polymerase eta